MIYSIVTLALCMLVGKYIGTCFGTLVGINADVGGAAAVAFPFLLLNIHHKREERRETDA